MSAISRDMLKVQDTMAADQLLKDVRIDLTSWSYIFSFDSPPVEIINYFNRIPIQQARLVRQFLHDLRLLHTLEPGSEAEQEAVEILEQIFRAQLAIVRAADALVDLALKIAIMYAGLAVAFGGLGTTDEAIIVVLGGLIVYAALRTYINLGLPAKGGDGFAFIFSLHSVRIKVGAVLSMAVAFVLSIAVNYGRGVYH